MTLPKLSDAGVPRQGDIIAGKYQVEAVLGAGGMGIVVSARHLDLGQRVAIKLLRSAFASDSDAVARFQREARALAGIRSEHVVRVHDVARLESGAPYLVMEHLAGEDLDQLLRARGPLPIAEVVDYVLQACEAIAEAHAAGIVHRDLKPANLFLTMRADGSSLVKVLDFGISKLTGLNDAGVPEGSLTATSDILGSPLYMSPEQLRSFKNVDARTDIWALGVILHRLITGHQPFDAESLSACITKIVADPPISLRVQRPDAPPELESLVLHCLEKDTSRRVQNVADLARSLLPFAPPRSALSVERIIGVLGLASPMEKSTLPLPAPREVSSSRLQSVPALPTHGSTSAPVASLTAGAVPPREGTRVSPVVAVAALGLLIAVVGTGVFLGSRASSVAALPTLETSAPAALSTVTMPPASVSVPPSSIPSAQPTSAPPVALSVVPSVAPSAAPAIAKKAPKSALTGSAPVAAPSAAKPSGKKLTDLLEKF